MKFLPPFLLASVVATCLARQPVPVEAPIDEPPAPLDPFPDASDNGLETAIGTACRRLRELGCPEGSPNLKGQTCFRIMTIAASYAPTGPDGGRIGLFPSQCIFESSSIEQVRLCGNASMIRIRCMARDE
jgi:hypothetical protein